LSSAPTPLLNLLGFGFLGPWLRAFCPDQKMQRCGCLLSVRRALTWGLGAWPAVVQEGDWTVGGLVGGWGDWSIPAVPSPVVWDCLLPFTSWGAARGARAGALREGIRNSEIKCISPGNAPHSADQIKRIKVRGGGGKLFRIKGEKTSPKGREAEMKKGRG
jgi:hypothetical protein